MKKKDTKKELLKIQVELRDSLTKSHSSIAGTISKCNKSILELKREIDDGQKVLVKKKSLMGFDDPERYTGKVLTVDHAILLFGDEVGYVLNKGTSSTTIRSVFKKKDLILQ